MSIAISGSSITFSDQTQMSTAAGSPFRNRIYNGDMRIDQRNAGASVTNAVGTIFLVDRFNCYGDQASKFTGQQSSLAPTGFVNSLLITSSSAYSVLAGEIFLVRQKIEGFSVADLGWGAAGAQAVTLSFWVRSSLTGTFGGSVQNSAQNRSYPFTYTISAANTWEQNTVTIAGDTSGTWVTNNGTGLTLSLGLGVGSTYSGTAGAWSGNPYFSATGAVSVVGTNGATFYITGVQLEAGSSATEFERRPIGTELALCQRYYEVYYQDSGSGWPVAAYYNASNYFSYWAFKVEKRAQATVTKIGGTWGGGSTPYIYGGISSASFSAAGVFGLNAGLNVAGLAANSEL